MNGKFLVVALVILLVNAAGLAADRSVLVHNSLQDIEAVKGKLKLKLVRTWGGENEEDENKFFETPADVAVDKDGLVYICDTHKHCIKAFTQSGEYVRTFGRRGRGPGDVYAPIAIALSPTGDLVVSEMGGQRIQRFNSGGKSTAIIKSERIPFWIGVTSKDELAVYNSTKTFQTKKLISIWDNKGKTIREIGTYHDKSKTHIGSDRLHFTLDDNDNLYAANTNTPVIRKYSADGKLLLAITYEAPYEIAEVEITLNEQGDEIQKKDKEEYNVEMIKRGKSLQVKGKRRPGICLSLGTDDQDRIFITTHRRLFTEEEQKARIIIYSYIEILRDKMDFTILDKVKDIYRLLVFNREGKLIAEASLPHFCDKIYVKGNRIFIVDGTYYQRVLEYEMSFEEGKEAN